LGISKSEAIDLSERFVLPVWFGEELLPEVEVSLTLDLVYKLFGLQADFRRVYSKEVPLLSFIGTFQDLRSL